MATFKHYGVIAVRFLQDKKHHHFISHVFIINVTDTGFTCPGKLYSKDEAIKLLATTKMYTYLWNYSIGNWIQGAEVHFETVGGNKYLRTLPDNTTKDNLTQLIDYDYFG